MLEQIKLQVNFLISDSPTWLRSAQIIVLEVSSINLNDHLLRVLRIEAKIFSILLMVFVVFSRSNL